MSRPSLGEEWQTALLHCESLTAEGGPRFRWLYQAQARIYRVLLSLYSSRYSQSDVPAFIPSQWELQQNPALIAVLPESAAVEKHPHPVKEGPQILQTLKRVAASNEPVPLGTWTAEQVRQSPFLLASGTKKKLRLRIIKKLQQAEIRHIKSSQVGRWQIHVWYEDRERAFYVLRAALESTPVQRQQTIAQRLEQCRRLKIVLGVMFGIVCASSVFLLRCFDTVENQSHVALACLNTAFCVIGIGIALLFLNIDREACVLKERSTKLESEQINA